MTQDEFKAQLHKLVEQAAESGFELPEMFPFVDELARAMRCSMQELSVAAPNVPELEGRTLRRGCYRTTIGNPMTFDQPRPIGRSTSAELR